MCLPARRVPRWHTFGSINSVYFQYNSPQNKYLGPSNEKPSNALAGILQCYTCLEKNLDIIAICSVLQHCDPALPELWLHHGHESI